MNIEEVAYKRGYRVTECGIFINPKGNPIGTIDKGYTCTSIRIKGSPKKLKAHRLQAFQKYGKALYKDNVVVRHHNSDSLDNSWKNILIGNQSENMMDIPEQVRIKRALRATSFVRKYNKEEVKAFHSIHKSYKKTMEFFGITSKGTLHHILNK